eukprot:TRINITY_DN17751_c0_g2_i1.p1 TRINITY_DN17751_c0_g2~~TRINITY_DN17751_c0_g2_i1.p1  ORF type:complete len:378 (+),score=32.31 TRINITY_DN17751_c0_g2_i1:90-1136(+)
MIDAIAPTHPEQLLRHGFAVDKFQRCPDFVADRHIKCRGPVQKIGTEESNPKHQPVIATIGLAFFWGAFDVEKGRNGCNTLFASEYQDETDVWSHIEAQLMINVLSSIFNQPLQSGMKLFEEVFSLPCQTTLDLLSNSGRQHYHNAFKAAFSALSESAVGMALTNKTLLQKLTKHAVPNLDSGASTPEAPSTPTKASEVRNMEQIVGLMKRSVDSKGEEENANLETCLSFVKHIVEILTDVVQNPLNVTFTQVLGETVRTGGDNCVLKGSCVGAIIGAHVGYSSLPRAWLECLHAKLYTCDLRAIGILMKMAEMFQRRAMRRLFPTEASLAKYYTYARVSTVVDEMPF